MTTISYFAAFTLGLITAFIISIWIHRQHKKDWQSEYRRLMGGIDGARIALDNGPYHRAADKILLDTYRGN
jgi:hypothetical protein